MCQSQRMTSGVPDGRSGMRVTVLDVDPDLAVALSGARRAQALRTSQAHLLWRDAGWWQAKDDADHARDGVPRCGSPS